MKPNPNPLIAVLLLLSLSIKAQTSTDTSGNDNRYRLLLRSGTFTPIKNITTDKTDQFNRRAIRSTGKTLAVIQFEKIPNAAERKQLQNAGIELLDYIPNNAYSVTITGSVNISVLTQLKARAIVELTPEQKMQPELAKGYFPSWAIKTAGTIDVWISFPKSFLYQTVQTELRSKNFDIISDFYKDYRIVILRIPQQRLNELASLPFIEYVEAAPHEEQPLLNKLTVNARANVLKSLLPGARNLDGSGVVVGVGDDANPLQHIDFAGRLINRAAIAGNFHGVHVTGVVGGAGNVLEQYTGFAPKATIISQQFNGILAFAPAYVQDYNMVVTNNSYGNIVNDCSTFGVYTLYSRILDQQAINMPHLQSVFAAGNSGSLSCSPYPSYFATVLGDYQSSKNPIIVGNTLELGTIGFFSSKGPVKDGRIKPEITTQGENVTSTFPVNSYTALSGTSISSPAVSGGLVLLYQRYRQLHGNADPTNALMKALLCNGATDLGNPGPDYTYGFGWMNLLRSVKMLEQNNYFIDSVDNGVADQYFITVPVNTAQLKVMLYWNDPAAAVLASHTLVNDLDLEVIDPSSDTILPFVLDTIPSNVNSNATTGVDHINNIEQVVINNPAAGTYTLRVKGTSVTQNPKQEYFLLYDTIPVSTALTYPIGGEHLVEGGTVYISWDSWGDPINTFKIEYSKNDGASWTLLDGNVAANLRQYQWTPPSTDTTELARIRITRNGTGMISTSERFIIIGVPVVTLSTTQCEGYFSIDWTRISGAADYEVMMLQGDQMTAVATTTDTTFTFSGLSKDSVYWVSVRPRINGTPGRRAQAISRQPDNGNCAGNISDNDLKIDTIVSPKSSGRKFTSTALTNNFPITIRIKNLDNTATTGNITVSYILNGGSPVTETITNPAITAGGTISYTFLTPANMSAIGTYNLKVSLSYTGDPVISNDSLTKTFKQLDNLPIDLTTIFLDDIEPATAKSYTTSQVGLEGLDRYDFTNSTSFGRLSTFINTGISYSGNRALTLDANSYVASGNADSLTGTFNIASYDTASDDIRLDFRYKNHNQQADPANKVWIRGDDQKNWIDVYDLYDNQKDADGSYKLSSSIELTDSLAAHLQNFSSSLQIRWGQWGQIITADDYGGAGYTFDNIRLYRVSNDIEVLRIDTPIVNSCNLSALTPVIITVRNHANTILSAVPVSFKVDGVIIANEILPPILPNSDTQYTFSAPANLATPGNHMVQAWVGLNTDTYHENDSAAVTLINSPIFTSFPYLENFETSNGSWYSEGKNNSWEYGTPSSAKINRAASGSKAWKTRLTGNYNDLEQSYLYSPCFNVSAMTTPTLSFSVALDLEDCGGGLCDGTYMEYSADGITWNRLGSFNQTGSTNWYNKNYTANNLWSVQNYTRWHVATIPLPIGLSQLRLRFAVSSDQSVNRDGIAIDDIHIYDNTFGIYSGATMGSPVMQSVPGGSGWVDFTSGGLIVSVKSPTQSMGNTEAQIYINAGAVRNNSGQYYHDRNITIKPQAGMENISDSASVRFYFLDTETENLINATGCATCTKPASAYDLGVSKYSDPDNNFENGTITDDNQGTWLFINSAKAVKVPFDKGYYAEFKVREFSEFWLNNGGFDKAQALPLKLINFTANKKTNKNVLVEWMTAAAFNVSRFEIEVAKGNTAYQRNQFVKIGEVVSQGNSSQQQNYNFTDAENNKSGAWYYRLKIIDNDGSFNYSAIRPVVFTEEKNWQVYPNPSAGIFYLSYQLDEGETIQVKLYDVNGKLVYQNHLLANGFVQKLSIDLHDQMFTSGLYLLEASTNERKQVYKLIKQ